jgi:hypothetical protein
MPMLEKISYRQWRNAYRVSNDTVELIVLADVGPRVIRYAFLDDDNVLHEISKEAGLVGGDQFRLYGGHRLWVWPKLSAPTFLTIDGFLLLRTAVQLASLHQWKTRYPAQIFGKSSTSRWMTPARTSQSLTALPITAELRPTFQSGARP